jgi:uncharacterized Zn-binding protein involved in type VI secretion
MATGYYLRVGDRTTCGGKILTGTPEIDWYGVDAAREGDFVSCGKNPGVSYKILGGTEGFMDESRQLAGTLDSISSCPCKAKFIPSIPDCYEKETVSSSRRSGVVAAAPIPAALMTKLRSEPEPVQHAQVAKKQNNFADTCKPEDNPLLSGVYIWTETTDAGHAFVSVHQNNSIYVYTRSTSTPTGDLVG